MFNSLDIYYLLCAKPCASPNQAFKDEYGPALPLRGTECKGRAGRVGKNKGGGPRLIEKVLHVLRFEKSVAHQAAFLFLNP